VNDISLHTRCPAACSWEPARAAYFWPPAKPPGEMFDVIGLWKTKASDVRGQPLPSGHLIQEEASEQLLEASRRFLATA
jgi:hypothetical protein